MFIIEDIPTEKPFDYAKHSTIGCGGKARQGYYPRSEIELCALLKQLPERPLILGNLSNVLPPDAGMDKAVVCTKKMTAIRRDGDSVYAEAGVTSGRFLQYLTQAGLSGLEFLAGIPCTVGGILYMNGGAGGQYIADRTVSVRIYRDGQVTDLPTADCAYAYKQSIFMQTGDVILGGKFHLTPTTPDTVKTEIQRWLLKRAHLPQGKSMGCVFKNPQGYTAGQLIDGAGLKGLRVGGALVSNQHANFIINDQNATAEDIRTLITQIKERVWQTYAVRLEEEIRYL